MKFIIPLFLFFTLISARKVNFNTNKNILTTYHYNSSCNLTPFKIDKLYIDDCNNIDNISFCNTNNNQTIFRSCVTIETSNSYIDNSFLKILITIFVFLLLFIIYKTFLELYIDSCFNSIYESITDWCYYKKVNNYENVNNFNYL